MERQDSDHILIEWLHAQFGIQPKQTEYDEQGFLRVLDLSNLDLPTVPRELGQFSQGSG